MLDFGPTSLEEIAELVGESEGDFLRNRGDEDLTMYGLLSDCAARGQVQAFVTTADGQVVGYITAMVEDPRREDVLLGPVYVRPAFRGRGIGGFQVRRFVRWAQQAGFATISTRTWGANSPSRRSLEAAGFVITGETADHRVNGDSTIWYQWRRPAGEFQR